MAKKEKVFIYLDALRESGITNMYGSPAYVRKAFPEVSQSEAVKLVAEWMETFEKRHPIGSE
jgi:uncharacterized circularly permuted ATP-grasp superfamily protein